MTNSKLIETKFTVTSINSEHITLEVEQLTYLDAEIYRSIASKLKLTILKQVPTLSFLVYTDINKPDPTHTKKIEFSWGSNASPLDTSLASKYALVRAGVLNACLNIGFDYSTPVLDTPDTVNISETIFNITNLSPHYKGYSDVKAPLSINGGVKKKNFDSQIIAQEIKQLLLTGEAWKPLLEDMTTEDLPTEDVTDLQKSKQNQPTLAQKQDEPDPEQTKETPQEKALREFLASVLRK